MLSEFLPVRDFPIEVFNVEAVRVDGHKDREVITT